MESLLHLAIMWSAVYFAALVAHRTRLTPVLYYLFFGAVMANIGVLPSESGPFIENFATLGIIIIMFALGFEENAANFLQSIRRAWGIALFGAIAPFAAAYGVAMWFFDDLSVALMVGLTMTATAVSLTMVSLKTLGLARSQAATLIMTSAVLDDIASLALVAVVVPIATGAAQPQLSDVAFVALKAIVFFAFISFLGGWLLPKVEDGWFSRIPVIGRGSISVIIGAARGEYATLTILLLALIIGLIAHAFGFHPAVGAYMAGLILREEYFDLGESRGNAWRITKRVIDDAAFKLVGPVFFVDLGTKIVFDPEVVTSVIPHILALLVAVFLAQVASAALAARYTAGSSWPEALLIGFGMLGRAELAFVVMDIAYVQNAILPREAFYMLMFTTFLLNILVPLTVAWWKPKYVHLDPWHAMPRGFERPKRPRDRSFRLLHEGRLDR